MDSVRVKTFQLASRAAPSEAGAGEVFTFIASDGAADRYQDRVSVEGWKLDSYNANPVILYNHDEFAGALVGAPVLPIGKGRAYVADGALRVDVQFDQADEFAKRVEAKVAGGYLNAVSVRYVMTKFRENELGGFDSLEQDLLEISIVTIPGNQRAVRVKAAQSVEFEALVKRLVAEALEAKSAEAEAEAKEEAPAEVKPSGGLMVECGAGCGWKAKACPDCGAEVKAGEAQPPAEEAPAAAAAAPGDEKPAVETSNPTELAKKLAALVLSNLQGN